MPAKKRKRPRGVVDTSVLVAGIAGFKSPDITPANPSAVFLREWIERDTFVWLLTDEILREYKEVLARRAVRRPLIGKVVNLIREQGEWIVVAALAGISPDPGDDPFCACAEYGQADFIVTLNPKDFPQTLLAAHVIRPEARIPTTRRGHQSRRGS